MREYSQRIALTRNSRGIYSLDTSIGCASGMQTKGGCYGDCYAAKSAKLYGYDFSKTVLRCFVDRSHEKRVVNQINRIPLDFVRIGTSGDPSENWEHTFSVLKVIQRANKEIVIITKHWTELTDEQLIFLSKINVVFNTSVSALDSPEMIERAVTQYKRLKPFCRSLLRIVSCDFNLENETGFMLSEIQHNLFKNEDVIDTVFRVSKHSQYVKEGIINVKTANFLGKKALISKFNKKTYFGKCSTCKEMCGVKMSNEAHEYPEKRFIPKQLNLFEL